MPLTTALMKCYIHFLSNGLQNVCGIIGNVDRRPPELNINANIRIKPNLVINSHRANAATAGEWSIVIQVLPIELCRGYLFIAAQDKIARLIVGSGTRVRVSEIRWYHLYDWAHKNGNKTCIGFAAALRIGQCYEAGPAALCYRRTESGIDTGTRAERISIITGIIRAQSLPTAQANCREMVKQWNG